MKDNNFTINVKTLNTDDEIKKIIISSNYYDIGIDDREELLNLLLDWTLKEKNTINTIKNRQL